jgi:hypothetical protein
MGEPELRFDEVVHRVGIDGTGQPHQELVHGLEGLFDPTGW